MKLARGTRDWAKLDPPMGKGWMLEYAMYCLGNGLVCAASCEFYYRLGKAHAEFEKIRGYGMPEQPKPGRKIVSG